MRPPEAAFDLRAAITQELNAALQELNRDIEPKAAHRCRVRLKKARALGRVGRLAAPGLAAVFDDTARSVMRSLAPLREAAALAETAQLFAERSKAEHARVLAQTAGALEAAAATLTPPDTESLRADLKDLLALAQVWPQPSARQLRAGATDIAKRARRMRRDARGAEDPAQRHKWRKREKARLYAAVLMKDAWPGKRRRKQLALLGDLLGLERDAGHLFARLEREPALAGGEPEAARARHTLEKHRARLAKRADKLGARLRAAGA